MPVINITQDQMERFQKIRKSRPQDSKAHETFNYLLSCFEGQKKITPIVDAEKEQAANASFKTAEELRRKVDFIDKNQEIHFAGRF